MSFNKQENGINEEQVTSYLKDVLSRVESDSDPDTLDTLKKLFKKNIPFSRRMYVAAHLVRQANSGYNRGGCFNRNDRFSHDRNDRSFDRRNERTQRPSRNDKTEKFADRTRTEHADDHEAEHTERAPRVQIDASLATTIFIGIGRNRRVYPRDLVGLLVSVAGLERERIGDIRVLANYSFIQLFTEDCEKAIAALNGYDYRGRKLSVSYSKQREEGTEDSNEGNGASDLSNAKSNDAGNVASSSYSAPVENNSSSSYSNDDERIPENVSNDSS